MTSMRELKKSGVARIYTAWVKDGKLGSVEMIDLTSAGHQPYLISMEEYAGCTVTDFENNMSKFDRMPDYILDSHNTLIEFREKDNRGI